MKYSTLPVLGRILSILLPTLMGAMAAVLAISNLMDEKGGG